jgi:uncharacterized protein
LLRRDKRGSFCRKQLVLSIDTESSDIENRYNAPHFRLWAGIRHGRRIHLMKLHATSTQQYQTVTAYDESGVEINAVHFRRSLVVMPEMAPVDWPVTSFDALTADDFARIDALSPDVVILGTGGRQRFIHPKLITSLNTRRVGVETMDNQAACRTYNILMAEGRKVALALILETSDD